MFKLRSISVALLSCTVLTAVSSGLANAADIETSALPAVSAFNGKIELMGGYANFEAIDSNQSFYGGSAISMPLGDMFGLQADISVVNSLGDTAIGGATHLFARDPNSYLLGVVGGVADLGGGDMLWGGGEAEFYMGNVSIEAVAGAVDLNVGGINAQDLFADANIAFYPTENLRLSIGASSVAGFESGKAGLEFMLTDMGMPISLKADATMGEDDFVAAKVGLAIYFGGNDSSKSLIRRHREDDPRIRSFITDNADQILGAVKSHSKKGPQCPLGWYYNPTFDTCYEVLG